MQLTKYLGDRDFWRTALRLALPIAFQKLLVSSFSMVDTIMIGSLGGTELAAVGLAGQFAFLMNVVFFGFSSGAAVFISQYWGNREHDNLRRTYGLALIGMTAISLAFSAFGYFGCEWFLERFTGERPVIEQGVAYFKIAIFSYPFIAINQAAGTLLGSTEEVKLPMWTSLISVAVNVVFNALFIFGLGMGVRGAAIATVMASAVGPVALYVISYRRKNQLIIPLKKLVGWDRVFIKKYVLISLPVLLNESVWAFGTMMYNNLFSNLSIEFFTAITIYRSVDNLMYVFFVGMCHACAVIVGKQIGAGQIEEGRLDAKRFALLGPLISLPIGLLVIALRTPILMLFSGVEMVVADYARQILFVYGLEFAVRNIPYMTIVGVFRAGGDTRIGLLYDVVCVWLIALPLTYLCGKVLNWPYISVFVVMLLAEDIVKSILCIRRLLSGKWIRPVTEARGGA